MIRRLEALAFGAAALSIMAAAACSGKARDDANELGLGAKGPGTGGTSGNGTGGIAIDVGGSSSASGGNGATGGAPLIPTGSAGMAGDAAGGDGTPEVCDGVDNDGNGIIDDVDAGHDGVCDCLNIGTIGQIGPWSNGGDIFAGWLDARSPMGAVSLDDKELTAALLAPLQVIVILHVDTTTISNTSAETGKELTAQAHHPFTDDEAKAFGDWLKSGGGAMSTIGYTGNEANEVVNVNRLLNQVGTAYSTSKLDLTGFITDWDDHPLTAGIKNIFIDNGVEPDSPNGTTLAHDASGRVALQVNQSGDGRVVVWGDEWMTYDSEWADVNDQQVELFWLNILKWLSPPKTCQVPIPPPMVR